MPSDEGDGWDSAIDIFDDLRSLVKNHEDDIRRFLGSDDSISLQDSEPLMNVHKTDEKIVIEMEVIEASGISDLSFKFDDDDNRLIVKSSGSSTEFKLPDNANVDEMSADFNNGVLSMEIPREVTKVFDMEDDETEGETGESDEEVEE